MKTRPAMYVCTVYTCSWMRKPLVYGSRHKNRAVRKYFVGKYKLSNGSEGTFPRQAPDTLLYDKRGARSEQTGRKKPRPSFPFSPLPPPSPFLPTLLPQNPYYNRKYPTLLARSPYLKIARTTLKENRSLQTEPYPDVSIMPPARPPPYPAHYMPPSL